MAEPAEEVDDRRHPAVHPVHRADQLDLRLPDVLDDAGGVSCAGEPGAVSHRVVRGVAVHADAHHPRHPDQQDSVPAEPGELAADRGVGGDPGDRDVADRVTGGTGAGVCGAAGAVLAAARGDAARVHAAHAAGEDLVPSALWRLKAPPLHRVLRNPGRAFMRPAGD